MHNYGQKSEKRGSNRKIILQEFIEHDTYQFQDGSLRIELFVIMVTLADQNGMFKG